MLYLYYKPSFVTEIMTNLYYQPSLFTEIILDSFAAGFEEPTLPLDDIVPVIIGTIVIGILTIFIYGWWVRSPLIQEQGQPEEPQPPRVVNLSAMYAYCSDNLYRAVVVDYFDPAGTVLGELFRGHNIRDLVRDAVYEGVVTIMWDNGQTPTSYRCFFTNITFTPDERNAAVEETRARIEARPFLETGHLEFPVHNNVTHYEGSEVIIVTGGRPVGLAFNFEGVPSNFHFPIYNGRRIPNLIESRSLIMTASSGILRPVNRNDQYEL